MKEREKSKKQICFLMPGHISSAIGGAEIQAYFLSEKFLELGWDVSYITALPTRKKKINYALRNPSIKFFYYKKYKFLSYEVFSLWKVINKVGPSIIYQRVDHIPTFIAGLYKIIYKSVFIYSCASDMNCQPWRWTKTLINEKHLSINPINLLKLFIKLLDNLIVDTLIFFGKKQASYVIVQSKQQQKLFEKYFKEKSIIINNGFNIPSSNELHEKQNIVLWVGNLRQIKQPKLFIDLFLKVNNNNWQFVMIGDVDKDDKIIKQISELQDSHPNFKYLGAMNIFETEKYFHKSKIIINTSVIEGFSNTFIQAWLNKVLLISLNVNPDNLLTEKKLGVYSENFNSLIIDVTNAMNNIDKYHSIIESSHNYAVENYNINNSVNKIISLINSKISEND